MTAEATTPCAKCASFAVQRRSGGLYCLVCGRQREGHKTRTVPATNARPQGAPPISGLGSSAPCPRCHSTAVQRKDDGLYCLVCSRKRSEHRTSTKASSNSQSDSSSQYANLQAKPNTSSSARSTGHQAAPAPSSPQSQGSVADGSRFLEQQLNVKIDQLIEGSIRLHMKSAEGTLVYRIPQSVDRQIESAVSNVLASGRPVIARSTWASRKTSRYWEPVFVTCFGEPGTRRPNVALALLAVSDFASSAASFSAIADRVNILPSNKSELYVMPPVVLWDGSVSPGGNIIGIQFRGAIVSGFALRPVHYAIDGARKIGQAFQSRTMGNDLVGAIRITQFQPNIFDQDLGGGERF